MSTILTCPRKPARFAVLTLLSLVLKIEIVESDYTVYAVLVHVYTAINTLKFFSVIICEVSLGDNE